MAMSTTCYFLRCRGGYPGRSHDPENPIHWLDEATLALGSEEQDGVERPFAPDVQALGIEAIRQVAVADATAAALRS